MSIHLIAMSLGDAPAPTRLLALAPVDMVIIALYFAMVLGIGFYLKRLHEDRRRLLPGRPRDDGLGRRA